MSETRLLGQVPVVISHSSKKLWELLRLLRTATRRLFSCLCPRPRAPILWIVVNAWLLVAARRARRLARLAAAFKNVQEMDSDDIKFLLGHLPVWVKDGDYESVRWLNKGLHAMWPQMNKMICRLLKNQLEPIINASLPENVSKMSFYKLDLGSMPPAITGVKHVRNQFGEFGLDIELKWGGNPKVGLVLLPSNSKTKWHPGQILDKIVEGTMYVALDTVVIEGRLRLFFTPLINDIVVGGLRMQLPERPLIDFNISSYGLNIMSLPAVSQLLRKSIEVDALGVLTWPNDIKFKWCSEEDEARSWSSQGTLPLGVLQIEMMECHLAERPGSKKEWCPYVVLTSSNAQKPGQSIVSRSATVMDATKFMMQFNQAVPVCYPSQAVRLTVLHDAGWTSAESDLPLAIVDIPFQQILDHVLAAEDLRRANDEMRVAETEGCLPVGETRRSAPAEEPRAEAAAEEPLAGADRAESTGLLGWSGVTNEICAEGGVSGVGAAGARGGGAPGFHLESTMEDSRAEGQTTSRFVKRGPWGRKRCLRSGGFQWWNPVTWVEPDADEASQGEGEAGSPSNVGPEPRRGGGTPAAAPLPLDPLLCPQGGWLPLQPLRGATLQLGGGMVMHSMRDYLLAFQEMNFLKQPSNQDDRARSRAQASASTVSVKEELQAIDAKLEDLGARPMGSGHNLPSWGSKPLHGRKPQGDSLRRSLSLSDLSEAGTMSGAQWAPKQGQLGSAGRLRKAPEWTVYNRSLLAQGQCVELTSNLMRALSRAGSGGLGLQSSNVCETLVAQQDRPTDQLSYGDRPGLLKLRIKFFPTIVRSPRENEAVGSLGMLLVHVSQLRFHNLLLKEAVAMLRIDEQLFWTESSHAKNGLVTWDEELTFVLNRRTAEYKRIEVVVVENYSSIGRILPFHASLQNADIKCGINIQLQNTIIRTSCNNMWPVYHMSSTSGSATEESRVSCGEISLQMKWMLSRDAEAVQTR
mmetsp:Transcript_39348/g.93236  ORF Transcript_39348/g.93236 Transcript_39348/m.93236 type:complete len:975 (-) Transcript_39348:844-3768(-)